MRPLLHAVLGSFLLLAALPARADALRGDLDLRGTWYVLVHYKDSATNNPDFERWLDRIWVLEESGSRLKWIDYPIVVFGDDSGRFERSGGQYARILEFWEPSPKQLQQIQSGLEVNPRGSKTKTVRGSASEGWRSRSAIGGFSANTLTYTETWIIEGDGGLPVFRIEDSLGGARAESLDGVTEYRTTEILPGGDELRGTFNRDGTRIGTFRILRAGAVGDVQGSRSQEQMRRKWEIEGMDGVLGTAMVGVSAEQVKADSEAVRAQVEKNIDASMRDRGLDLVRYQGGVDDVVDQIMAELKRGTSPEDVEAMVRQGKIAPRSMRRRR
ncbi:MAG: hypothetical protein JRG85_10225 [Deltaproteobacteria bacterium]|nr:hypothetical protein [Deltaproteobacteria bacterium]